MNQADRNPEDQFDWEHVNQDRPPAAPVSPSDASSGGGAWDVAARHLTVYEDKDRKSPILAELSPGDKVRFGTMAEKNGGFWREVTLPDERKGYTWAGRAKPVAHLLVLAALPIAALVGVLIILGISFYQSTAPSQNQLPGPDTGPSLINFSITTRPGNPFAERREGTVIVLVNDERDLSGVYIDKMWVLDETGRMHDVNLIGENKLGEWKKGEEKTFSTGLSAVREVFVIGQAKGNQKIQMHKKW